MKSIALSLKEEDLSFLEAFVSKGKHKAREITRANILLLAHKKKGNEAIADALSTNRHTVWEIKRKYAEKGLDAALHDAPRPGQPPKYVIKHETEIAAMACTKPPDGRKRWTLVLLEQELRKRGGDYKTVNRESIRLILKKQNKAMDKKDVVYWQDRRKIQGMHVRRS